MSKISPQHISGTFSSILSQLNPQDVEEFYKGYQYWHLQHQIGMLHIRLSEVHRQIGENTERIQEVQPTAIELATLARLQSKGVSDVDLLDRMLERGELWLDRTMQRLDYLEQLDDFISDDYTQWCQHALEGAYDWIDSVLDGSATPQPVPATLSITNEDVKEEELINATEELFLQKISNDEDGAFTQEITMKRSAIRASDIEEDAQGSEITHAEKEATTLENSSMIMEEAHPIVSAEDTKELLDAVEGATTFENATPEMDGAIQSDTTGGTTITKTGDDTRLKSSPLEEQLAVDSNATSINEQSSPQEASEIASITQKSSSSQTAVAFEHVPQKRPGFIKRFLGKVWGS